MIDKLFTFTDKDGNDFLCKNGRLFLRPKGKSERKIGQIYTTDKGTVIYKKYEDEKDIYRKTNAWSVPVSIYDKVDKIWFFSDANDYKFVVGSADVAYFHFAKSGTEKKVYIPLDYWKINKKNTIK
jgi:hypothetical protein